MLNLRKVALIAAIALAVARLSSIGGQVWAVTEISAPAWRAALSLLVNDLFLAPLPILLWVVWRGDGNIAVSPTHRRIAALLAIARAGLILAPETWGLAQLLSRDWTNIELASGITVASKLKDWLVTAKPWPQLWYLTTVLAEAAFVWFLIALVRGRRNVGRAETRRSYWLREMAALTTIVSGLAVILAFVMRVYGFLQARHDPEQLWLGAFSGPHYFVQTIYGLVPETSSMLLAWIIYKSVPAQTTEIAAE